ncbi:K02A2.6-like [Cordylochernes scorpioides]|uniref:K02A2.6-like n=1 Tax=Cordylochernes scorpioides TaxID=51811 RepID=A0ABY6KPU7_9ARAC|nr:K02A2.6-like [Cordylochernes scorpioides]
MPGHRKRRQFKQTDAFTRGMVIGLKRAGWNVGATRVTSARVDRRILRQAVAAPQATCTAILQHVQDTLDHSISTRTISRRLVANGLHSCRPLRRLPLTPPNRRQRLECGRARSTWMTEWHRVVFSDESRFCLSSDSRRVRVWRRRGERSNPAAIVERPTVRQRGIMVWGAIAYDSRSPLLRIQGTMTAQRYVDDVLRPQDYARPHTAHISQQALQDAQMLPWPPYSLDLSPIEHVWDIIGRRLHALPQPRSEDELWQMVEREWRAIPQDAIRTLIDSLPRRVAACIAHDNARPHVANLTIETINKLNCKVIIHPPYSSDLAPSDYHLFGHKRILRGMTINTDDENVLVKCPISQKTFSPLIARSSSTPYCVPLVISPVKNPPPRPNYCAINHHKSPTLQESAGYIMENEQDQDAKNGGNVTRKRKKAIGVGETRRTLAEKILQLTAALTQARSTQRTETDLPPSDGIYAARQFFQAYDRKMDGALSYLTRHHEKPPPTMPDPYISTPRKTGVWTASYKPAQHASARAVRTAPHPPHAQHPTPGQDARDTPAFRQPDSVIQQDSSHKKHTRDHTSSHNSHTRKHRNKRDTRTKRRQKHHSNTCTTTASTTTPFTRNIETIHAIQQTHNRKTLRSFLSAVNAYKKFIPDYARLRTPLNNLLKKDVTWVWDDKCKKAFTSLKESLTTHPTLHLYQEGLQCQVSCHASTLSIPGILKQVHPDGKTYPVQYFNRSLRSHERNYSSSELECLAIVESVDKFRVCLMDRKFTIFSDHHAMQWLKTIKNPAGRLIRWRLRLSRYEYEVRYIKGVKQYETDIITRNPFCGFLDAPSLRTISLSHLEIII